MSQRYTSKSSAQREANKRTGNGRVAEVTTHRGLFGTRYGVRNTGKIANPVQRRMARNGLTR